MAHHHPKMHRLCQRAAEGKRVLSQNAVAVAQLRVLLARERSPRPDSPRTDFTTCGTRRRRSCSSRAFRSSSREVPGHSTIVLTLDTGSHLVRAIHRDAAAEKAAVFRAWQHFRKRFSTTSAQRA